MLTSATFEELGTHVWYFSNVTKIFAASFMSLVPKILQMRREGAPAAASPVRSQPEKG